MYRIVEHSLRKKHQANEERGSQCSPPPAKKVGILAQFLKTQHDDVDNEMQENQHINPEKVREIVSAELDIYSKIACNVDADVNLIQWWQSVKHVLPHLFEFAMYILAIPASSASVEGHFSTAQQVVTARRNRLSPNNIRNILVSRQNRDLLANHNINNELEDGVDVLLTESDPD